MQEWANTQATHAPKGITNKEKYDLDIQAIQQLEDRAAKDYKKQVNKALLKKQSKELMKTSIAEFRSVAIKRAIGLLVHEFAQEAFITVRLCIKKFKANAAGKIKQLLSDITEGLKRLAKRIQSKAKKMLADSMMSGIGGKLPYEY